MRKAPSKKPQGTVKRKKAGKDFPLTLHFDEDGMEIITSAAAAADDIRANWGRRMLLKAAREQLGLGPAEPLRPPDRPGK